MSARSRIGAQTRRRSAKRVEAVEGVHGAMGFGLGDDGLRVTGREQPSGRVRIMSSMAA